MTCGDAGRRRTFFSWRSTLEPCPSFSCSSSSSLCERRGAQVMGGRANQRTVISDHLTVISNCRVLQGRAPGAEGHEWRRPPRFGAAGTQRAPERGRAVEKVPTFITQHSAPSILFHQLSSLNTTGEIHGVLEQCKLTYALCRESGMSELESIELAQLKYNL